MKAASSYDVIRILSYADLRDLIVGHCIADGVLELFAFGAMGFGFERTQA